ncbi:MAG: winged helix-turn-helix transcriptional regulator [Erysipelotrichaceae bacterium]|nr:winged helix-turn-helix transcriptional regulator [Erysipelotrichaceae bacterium]
MEKAGLISRKQYNTIPPMMEYSLAEKGKTLIRL